MKEKLWNNSHAYLHSWIPDFAWSSGIYIDSFCSGRAKSRCGGVLAVNFDDFYRQHSLGFHTFGTVLLWFLLILTSSTSFDDYLKLGATGANLGQIGANHRPAGLGQADRPTPATPCHEISWRVTWARGWVTPRWVLYNSWVKDERPEPSWAEVKTRDNSKNQSPIQPEKQHGPSDQQVGAKRAWAKLEPGPPA